MKRLLLLSLTLTLTLATAVSAQASDKKRAKGNGNAVSYARTSGSSGQPRARVYHGGGVTNYAPRHSRHVHNVYGSPVRHSKRTNRVRYY